MVEGQPPAQGLICELCGESFVYPEAERARDDQMGYPPPRACPACLQKRRAEGARKRAARRPRPRRFRR